MCQELARAETPLELVDAPRLERFTALLRNAEVLRFSRQFYG